MKFLNSINSPYKFNGKQLDEETGNYYYGARYYNPEISLWLSVDPLAEKYPGWSPYNYTLQNPVKLVDPDGRSVAEPDDIIIHGLGGTELTIPTAGEEDYDVYLPTTIGGKSRKLDLGLGNVDPSRMAFGYQAEISGSGALTFGGKASGGFTTVRFFGGDYSDYNYHYAQGELTGNTGVQGGADLNAELNFFVAYNTSDEKVMPQTFSGSAENYELAADIKTPFGGGGLTIGGFKSGDWKGVYAGFDIGIGGKLNILSAGKGWSESILLYNLKPTRDRSWSDRLTNSIPSSLPRLIQAGIQYSNKD